MDKLGQLPRISHGDGNQPRLRLSPIRIEGTTEDSQQDELALHGFGAPYSARHLVVIVKNRWTQLLRSTGSDPPGSPVFGALDISKS